MQSAADTRASPGSVGPDRYGAEHKGEIYGPWFQPVYLGFKTPSKSGSLKQFLKIMVNDGLMV